ncbi:retrotransposon protein, putative, ty1-copia subclass [Tanacetum coccineum]
MEMETDIENMTLNEYLEYEAVKKSDYGIMFDPKTKKNPLNDHSYSFTPQFFAQPPDTSNTLVDKKDSDFDEILDDFFKDVDLEKEEAEVDDDDDDKDTYDIWDIAVKDVERIRQFLTPNVPDEMDEVIQPLIPQPIHSTPPNDDYVAPTTKLILDELLEEFRDEIVNVTMVDKKDDSNPTKDIEELERLLAKDPQSHFIEIQVHLVITKPELIIHTPSWYGLKSSFPYPVANEHPKGFGNTEGGLDLVSYVIRRTVEHGISKKCIDKLQRDGILQSTHDESLKKCKSCITGKIARKPFPYQVERAKDLLGLIHTDVSGHFRIVSREGASYFITFTDDFSRYGYVYLMKHKHEVFETFNVFENEVENQLTKKIKAIRSDRVREYLSYPKETTGYYFYYPSENKIFVARNAEFFENSLIVQETSGSHGLLKMSGSDEGLELIQE